MISVPKVAGGASSIFLVQLTSPIEEGRIGRIGDGTTCSMELCFAQVEEHLKAVHSQGGKKASKKRKQAFEWRCRFVCSSKSAV